MKQVNEHDAEYWSARALQPLLGYSQWRRFEQAGQYVVVQCKHWNAKQVPHNDVHQLLGVMATERASGAVLVTSGEFTAYAREAAAKIGNIELIDGAGLRQRLGPLMPEPRRIPMVERPWQPVVEKYTGVAVDALLNKIGGSRRPRVARYGIWVLLLKGLLPLVLIALAFFMFNRGIESLGHGLKPLPSSSLAAPAVSAKPVAHVATQPVVRSLSGYIPPPASSAQKSVIAEIGAADEMMTPEQLEEWKRKNAESMKVLESSTRELQH